MKRMLDQKDIAKLKVLLSKISIDGNYVIIPAMKTGEVILDDWNSLLIGEDELPVFPDFTDNAGKVVKVNESEGGFEYGEVSGGTQLYKHTIPADSGKTIIFIDNSNVEIDYGNFVSRFENSIACSIGGSSMSRSVLRCYSIGSAILLEYVFTDSGSIAYTTINIPIGTTLVDTITAL